MVFSAQNKNSRKDEEKLPPCKRCGRPGCQPIRCPRPKPPTEK